VLANTIFRQNDGKQQIAWNTETLGVDIMQRIEITCYLLGEIAALLPSKANATIGFTEILIDDHNLIDLPVVAPSGFSLAGKGCARFT
jgi:hypothetical protein